MNVFRFIFFAGISLLASQTVAQRMVKKDLEGDWKIFLNDRYEPFSDEHTVKTIYFWIDADKFPGDRLYIRSTSPFSVFINGKFISDKNDHFTIDSIAERFSSSKFLVAVHQEKIVRTALRTTIETAAQKVVSALEPNNRPFTFFRDFVVIASIVLLLMLIIVMRLNPKLASDYFSVTRIFSLRESDDGQVYTRISNSTNVLFYGFSSLILGFYLMIIFHFVAPVYSIAGNFQTDSFFSATGQWLILSLIILVVFFLKMILIYAISGMFGSREVAGIHFFNWIRMLLIVFGVMSITLFIYFVMRGQSIGFHVILLKLIGWCLAMWTIIIFLKLNGRSGYSLFHLFSYICATEIIPLLIIITVLYK